jgi:hypothetical protein
MKKIKEIESIVEVSKALNIGKYNIIGLLTNSRKKAGDLFSSI